MRCPPRCPIATGNATTFCQGGSIVLNSSAAAGYQWYRAGTAPVPGATGPSTFTITYDNAPTDYQAGGYAVRAELHNDNCAGETTGTLTIGQALLTVTTNSKSKTYGSSFDAATYSGSLSGNVASDHLGLASYANAGAAASATITAGPYATTATLSDPNNRLFNYSVTTSYGSLTIDPAGLTVTA